MIQNRMKEYLKKKENQKLVCVDKEDRLKSSLARVKLLHKHLHDKYYINRLNYLILMKDFLIMDSEFKLKVIS